MHLEARTSSQGLLEYPAGATARRTALADRILKFYDEHSRLMLGMVVVFYLAAFNGEWHAEPDSALYMTIARNLARGLGYTYHGQVNSLAYPGLPWLLAGFFKVFGVGKLWPAHVFMLLCGFGVLALTYRLVLLHADRAMAVLATCMTGMTQIVFRYCFQIRNDMPFLLGVMAFLVGYEAICVKMEGKRERINPWDIALLAAGLLIAMVMRPSMWVLLVSVVGGLAWGLRKKQWRKVALPALAGIVVVAALWWFLDPRHSRGVGAYEASLMNMVSNGHQFWHETLPTNLYKMFEPTVAESTVGMEVYARINTLIGVLVLTLGVMLVRQRVVWGLFVLGTALCLVIQPTGRYLLAVAPLLTLAWLTTAININRVLRNRWGSVLFVLTMLLWILPNFWEVIHETVEQRKMPFYAHYKHGMMQAPAEMAREIKHDVRPGDVVLIQDNWGRIMTWWSDRDVIDMQEAGDLTTLKARAFAVEPMDPALVNSLLVAGWTPGTLIATAPGKTGSKPWELRALEKPAIPSAPVSAGAGAGNGRP